MTEEKFKGIKDIAENIEIKKHRLIKIDRLLTSDNLSCLIQGKPSDSFRELDYGFYDNDIVKDALKVQRERLVIELEELKKIFESI